VRNLHAREPGGPMSCPSGLITGRAAQGTLRRYA
jgi:hypothetical protein